MNLIQKIKHLGSSWSVKRATYLYCHENSNVQAFRRESPQYIKPAEKNLLNSKRMMFYKERLDYKSSDDKEIPPFLIFGGILSFFGLDEDSKRERKYEKEIENTSEEDFDDKLRNVLRPAIINMQEGEYEKAERIFHIALRMAQDVDHKDAVLYIHDLLANLAYEVEDYTKAEKLFVDVMQRQISYKGVAKDDNSIIAMSLKLAAIFSKTEQHEKARQGFEFCIDTTEKKLKAGIRDEDTMVLWGMSRDVYGQYLMSLGYHQKARDQFKQAYDISCEINGENDEQSLVLLNSLGTISATLGDANMAELYFKELIQKARKNNSEHLAHYLVNYGVVNVQLNLYDEAKRNCNEALQLAKKTRSDQAYNQSQNCLKALKETMENKKP